MKKIFIIVLWTLLPIGIMAQTEEFTENGIVSLNGNEGFTVKSPKGDFIFKPYGLIQTSAQLNYYDDEGLDKAYNQDNIANSGFSIPYAIMGFQGKAFNRITFNLAINAAGSGGALLQQAWFDIKMNNALAVKIGKMKTPFQHGFLTTLGETLLPQVPTSMTASVILPHTLNAVTPRFMTGWDLGLEIHGLLARQWGYELGLWNGSGAGVNSATKTLSDDWHIPSLLYAGRLAYMPKGIMPATQGNPNRLHENKWMVAVSSSINVESESESTNDLRLGLEYAWLYKRLYLGAEFYYMDMGFTKRQKINEHYHFWGGYAQAGYFVTPLTQIAVRYDFMDRNGTGKDGMLNMPAIGLNYFFKGCNLKLQGMYQYIGRTGHATQLDRDNDDLGIAKHSASILLQYTF